MRRVVPVLGLVVAAGCAEQLTFEEARVAAVQSASPNLAPAAGATVSIAARVVDQRGKGVPGQVVTFSPAAGTVNPAQATTNNDGVATTQWTAGTTAGSQTVSVAVPAAAGVASTIPATVVPAAPASATLSRGAYTFDALTDTVTYQATTVVDAFGNTVTNPTLTWVSSDTTIVRVVTPGLFRSVGNGTATVSVRAGTTTLASAPVTVAQVATQIALTPSRSRVVAVNDTLRLTVAARDRLNQVIANPVGITYASNNASAVAVPNSAVPTVRAAGTGRATITATRGPVTATVFVAAGPAVPTLVQASPDTARVFSSSRTSTFAAQVFDQDTVAIAGRSVTWSSLDVTIATVNAASGAATSLRQGTARIVATDAAASLADTVRYVVTQVVASIAVADSVQVAQSDTVALLPTARDSAGASIAGAGFTYSSNATGTATVNSLGRVVGVANGTANVTVTSGGVSRVVPVRVLGATLWRELLVTSNVGCGITTGNELYCFGGDFWGMNGFSATRRDSFNLRPTRPQGTSTLRFSAISMNGATACALAQDGQVYCSGAGSQGALAVNPLSLSNNPACTGGNCRFRSQFLAIATPFRFTKIAASRNGHCGIDGTTFRVVCWGENFGGQAGVLQVGADTAIISPRFMTDTMTFSDITGVSDAMCGIARADGRVYCWGGPAWGVKGATVAGTSPAATYAVAPTLLAGAPVFDRLVRSGHGYTHPLCGITSGGDLWCWGYNGWAQLGRAANLTANAPARVNLPGAVADASMGGTNGCAVLTSGELYCWGSNANREAGLEPTGAVCSGGGTDPIVNVTEITAAVSCVPTPTRVMPSLTFARVTTFSSAFAFRDGNPGGATCALRPSGVAYCWGSAAWREGGNFPTGGTATPYLIGAPTN